MRISTSQYFTQSVATMDSQQAQMNQLYQQLSSGVSLSTPSDNPLGAAQAVQLSMTVSTLTQYTANQSSALTSLQAADVTLTNVNGLLNSIHSVVIQAGNGSLNDSDRSALATQLTGYRNQLMTLANSTDGAGNYLFAGFQGTTAPFSNKPGGGATYSGDNGARMVQVASSRQIALGNTGAQVFMSVPPIGSAPVPAAGASNTGTGTIGAVSITNPVSPANAHQFTIAFGGTAAAPTYTVTDNTLGTTGAAQAYSAGAGINLGGQTVAVSGTPAAGDTFTVTPAPQAGTDVFATLDTMIAALQTPVGSSTAQAAALANAMTTGTTKLNNMMTNVLTVQASVGGREQEIQALQQTTSSNSTQTQSSLANLTSTNMTAAISQYELTQTSLQAAQKAFVQMQQLSLFQYIQ
jgi:flagellar hook-associated protein 3 FlgL